MVQERGKDLDEDVIFCRDPLGMQVDEDVRALWNDEEVRLCACACVSGA